MKRNEVTYGGVDFHYGTARNGRGRILQPKSPGLVDAEGMLLESVKDPSDRLRVDLAKCLSIELGECEPFKGRIRTSPTSTLTIAARGLHNDRILREHDHRKIDAVVMTGIGPREPTIVVERMEAFRRMEEHGKMLHDPFVIEHAQRATVKYNEFATIVAEIGRCFLSGQTRDAYYTLDGLYQFIDKLMLALIVAENQAQVYTTTSPQIDAHDSAKAFYTDLFAVIERFYACVYRTANRHTKKWEAPITTESGTKPAHSLFLMTTLDDTKGTPNAFHAAYDSSMGSRKWAEVLLDRSSSQQRVERAMLMSTGEFAV